MTKEQQLPALEDEFSRELTNSMVEKFLRRVVGWVGSWFFLFLNVIWFFIWIICGRYYDLLTFWVSLEAIILAILILINGNRGLESDRNRAIKDYKIDLSTARKLKNIEKEIKELRSYIQNRFPVT
ncbi:DUF1003 domain-containing protein [Patescibacteria group bacterium]|nr:DUF1003 domain-containing protein [Patescibacteria group bacterium]MBU1868076.1 DUF1003 domain-containing protein [Patescibacteria group bacterium]